LTEKATGLKLSGILWLQGERDANAIHDGKLKPAEYQAALTDLINRFRKSFGEKQLFILSKPVISLGGFRMATIQLEPYN